MFLRSNHPILRFSWIFYIIYSHDITNAAALSFYIALVECLRRTIWSTFRVENEHVANVLTYRATRELPLPYAMHSSADLEGQQRKTGDTSKTRNERPRIAEAHATDFERKALDGLHMDDVNVDSEDESDAEPPSGSNSPPDTDNDE
ncbi:protein of unknown function [Taphrina deformans PYCC 5710]|uniref:EXS domain-containing protein n=1 Tax=Taphrina deformans (strain PYCC 5710 / ATCC 11124 / CBS 356.35 / IMI 108563 / JCM 9778 / NBRC 8474) TaxID=1097556 RepID=R4XDP1_TAPDE|nr:protein of unknown function [Taphrina deformans PYCC 5710]|eukprot:CCG83950.1 protein of unknown function [Taphrina deformans PYCC 5710]